MQGIFILLAPRPPDETACLDMRIAWIEDMDEIADFIYDIAVIGIVRITDILPFSYPCQIGKDRESQIR